MAQLNVNGTTLHVEDSGGSGPPVLFSHGLLWSTRLFDDQVASLRGRYRCVAYDHRGQGRSAVPPGRSIPIEVLFHDAVALIGALGLAPCHFVGLSMGGFVGMRLAARRPEMVRSLTLMETSAGPAPAAHVPRYQRLNLAARTRGVRAVTGPVMPILFGQTGLADPRRVAAWRRELLRNRRSVYKAVNGVLERAPVLDELRHVRAPTLVIVGEEDVATPPARAVEIAGHIDGARLLRIPAAGHSSPVEQPEAVTAALRGFLAEVSTAGDCP